MISIPRIVFLFLWWTPDSFCSSSSFSPPPRAELRPPDPSPPPEEEHVWRGTLFIPAGREQQQQQQRRREFRPYLHPYLQQQQQQHIVQVHPYFLQQQRQRQRLQQQQQQQQQQESSSSSSSVLPDLTSGVKAVGEGLTAIMRLLQVFPSIEGEAGDEGEGDRGQEGGGDFSVPWKTLDKLDRRQCRVSSSVLFPCDRPLVRNYYRPPAASRLAPGDIRALAAMGDFAAAGTGARAAELPESGTDYRGASFVTGGDGSWRDNLSIANILRRFNPHLVGASRGSGKSSSSRAGLNVAEKSSTSADLVAQAKALIRRTKALATVDPVRDWKMVVIAIGHTELCRHSCAPNATAAKDNLRDNGPTFVSASDFALNVAEALDLLSRELPNTLAVVASPPADPAALSAAAPHRPVACRIAASAFCPCAQVDGGRLTAEMARRYGEELRRVVSSGRYDNYEDFAVILSPALEDLEVPVARAPADSFLRVLGSKWPDLSYLAPNCLYPSQKLHALMAKSLWNSLFQESGLRDGFDPEARLLCPTHSSPYFVTRERRISAVRPPAQQSEKEDSEEEGSEEDEEEESEEEDLEKKRRRGRRGAGYQTRRGGDGCGIV